MAVTNLGEAIRVLATQPIALILCGVHFDESRMFDLLRHAVQSHPHIPFVVCQSLTRFSSEIAREGVEIASKALGAVEFVDLHDLERLHGKKRKYEEFRKLVLRFLPET